MVGMLSVLTWMECLTKMTPDFPLPVICNTGQTDFTELSITKPLVGNLETIFTEQE